MKYREVEMTTKTCQLDTSYFHSLFPYGTYEVVCVFCITEIWVCVKGNGIQNENEYSHCLVIYGNGTSELSHPVCF